MRSLFSPMNLKALVLGTAFAVSSCAANKPVCQSYSDKTVSCTKEDSDLILVYDGNFLVGTIGETYCELMVGFRSSKERTYYVDYGCDETVDTCVYESSSLGFDHDNESSVGTFSMRTRSSFGGSYDSFFKRKKEYLLEGKK